MAALTITAANVVADPNAQLGVGVAAVTIGPGQTVYVDTSVSPNVIRLADADASALTSVVKGIAVNAATAGQPISWISSGNLALGAILTAGQWYVNGATAGAINPITDLASNWYSSVVGYATTTSNLLVTIQNTAVKLV